MAEKVAQSTKGHEAHINDEKREAVDVLKQQFGEVKDFIFTDYRGLTVEQITELRSKLREQEAEYKVIKNNFARIAFQQMKSPDAVAEYLVGPTAIAMTKGEATPVVKSLIDFSREWTVQVKGGLISGLVFDAKQVEAFSRLPTRPELLSMLMRTMNAPLQNMVYAMNGVTTKLVRTLQAVADKKSAA
jgi:large subunit ribosomal protein L10